MFLRFLVASSLLLSPLVATQALARDATTSVDAVAASTSWVGGRWRIHQRNNGGAEYTGTLHFTQYGNTVSGHVLWDNHAPGTLSGYIKDGRVFFVVGYPGGLVGNYSANIYGEYLSEGGGYDNTGTQTCVWSGRRA